MRLLFISLFFSAAVSAQNVNEIYNSIRLLNKAPLEFFTIKEKIISISFDSLQNDTSFFLIPNSNILYGKININNSTDFLKYNNRFYKLSLVEEKSSIPFDMDVLNAGIVKFKYEDDEFISLYSTGTGLNKSGSFQNIGLNLIIAIDSNKLSVNCFINCVPDTLSIMDFDNDRNLDYLKFIDNPVISNEGNVLLYKFNKKDKLFYRTSLRKYKKKRAKKILIN